MTNNYARHIGRKQSDTKSKVEGTGELVFFENSAPDRLLEQSDVWAFWRMPANVGRRAFDGRLIGVSQ